ncbi:MAG: CDP-alcohol phosphatidyltransferase family protein [Nitrospinales bacterium]
MNRLHQILTGVREIRKTCWDVDAQSQSYRNDPANWEPIYFSRKISVWVTYFLKDTSVTPNQVTAAWVIMGGVGALLLAVPAYWVQLAGLFLFWTAMLLDHVDGELARVKKIFSQNGDLLDMLGHQFHYPLVFGALTFGVVLQGGHPVIIFFGILAAVFTTPLAKLKENILLLSTLRFLGQAIPPASQEKDKAPQRPSLRTLLGTIHTHVVMLYTLIPAVIFEKTGLYLVFYGATIIPILVIKYFARSRELEEIFRDPSLLSEHLRPEWLESESEPAPPPAPAEVRE